MDVCPSPEELRRFRDEELGDGARQVIATHVNRCASCQKWLDDEQSPELAKELLAAKVVFSLTRDAGPLAATQIESATGPGATQPLSPRSAQRNGMVGADLPDQVGGYKVVARLDGGGQAELYRVNDPLMARELALKLGRKPFDADSPAECDELVREARALAALRHDGLVNVHALGFLEDGRPYLVLDLVLGANLHDHVGAGRLDPRRVAEVVKQVAQVVEHLHSRGVVHLDIKPRNVMIDDHGRPRLIDLGLARLRYAWAPEPDLPRGGTLDYLAPEQARGEVDRIGRATDIFGLGGALYFLLTGRALYEGADHDALLAQAQRGEYDAQALHDTEVPEPLKQICARALAHDPADRYSSAGDLASDLKRFLEDAPRPDRSRGISRRVVFAGSALTVFIIFGAIWAMTWRFFVRETPDTGNGLPGTPPLVSSSRSSDGRIASAWPGPEAPSIPSVQRFEIRHFPKLDAKRFDPRRVGILGWSSFTAREDDEATVWAELSGTAYAYLIAFRPDGTDELCDPDDEDTLPPRKKQPMYPPPTKSHERYRLSEGAGLCAFAVVVSRGPLPPYRQWKRCLGPMPWAARLPCESGVVWHDDARGLEPLLADDPAGSRGKGVKARGSGEPVARLASWLRALPGVDAVTLEAFPVEPAPGHVTVSLSQHRTARSYFPRPCGERVAEGRVRGSGRW
jgi:serine/threonine protein kinase